MFTKPSFTYENYISAHTGQQNMQLINFLRNTTRISIKKISRAEGAMTLTASAAEHGPAVVMLGSGAKCRAGARGVAGSSTCLVVLLQRC